MSQVRLYVGNLPYSIDQTGLVAIFSNFGIAAMSPQIIMDRETGRPKGFGFVEVAGQKEADVAIAQVSGSSVENRVIRVSIANERPSRGAPRSGGGPSFEQRGGGGGRDAGRDGGRGGRGRRGGGRDSTWE